MASGTNPTQFHQPLKGEQYRTYAHFSIEITLKSPISIDYWLCMIILTSSSYNVFSATAGSVSHAGLSAFIPTCHIAPYISKNLRTATSHVIAYLIIATRILIEVAEMDKEKPEECTFSSASAHVSVNRFIPFAGSSRISIPSGHTTMRASAWARGVPIPYFGASIVTGGMKRRAAAPPSGGGELQAPARARTTYLYVLCGGRGGCYYGGVVGSVARGLKGCVRGGAGGATPVRGRRFGGAV